ncbi:MAG: hypothetical protein LUI10_02290 [Lachnospiraceae bacterium]|nr:hypothetical protein [Lachnospiraceae bacterium]
MKIRHILPAVLIVSMFLTGCQTSEISTFDRDTIELAKDQSLTYTIVTDFEESYYDVDELTQMADEEADQTGLGIRVQSAEVTAGVIRFTYEMDSASDYETFMDTSCYLGTISSAFDDNYRLKVTVNSVKDDSQIILSDVSRTDYDIFIWNEVIAVCCPGKIMYFSTNLELTDDYSVAPLSESTGPYYVVYK